MRKILALALGLLATVGALTLTTGPAQAATTTAPTPTFASCFASGRQPHHWQLACGDGNGYFDRATWTHWGQTYASGSARLWANTCKPNCAAGNYHLYRVHVRLDRVAHTATGHRYFTRFHYGRTTLAYTYRLTARPPYPCPTCTQG